MSDLDSQVRRWRKRQERRSSLSSRELDELEDHLRAHVDLDMELTPALTPARAFAQATTVIGAPEKLSKEFARAGKPRWRRLVFAGWALFAVSFVLPAFGERATPLFGGWADTIFVLNRDAMSGWQAFTEALFFGGLLGKLSAVTNLLVLVTLLTLRIPRRRHVRWIWWPVAAAGVLNLVYWPIWTVTGGDSLANLLPGYWAWVASFLCVAAGFWLRNREWASISVTKEAA